MACCFYIIICLFFIVLQTSIIPYLPFSGIFYDILVPFVIHTGLRPIRESLPVVLLGGIAMDQLSGTPFGLYLFTYIWLFILVKWLATFLDVNNIFLMPVIVGAGVLLENLIFSGTVAFLIPDAKFSITSANRVLIQFLSAFATGVFIVLLLNLTNKKLNTWIGERSTCKIRNLMMLFHK
jgi:rod shape-determining protein MreD